MPVWKYSNKTVMKETADASFNAVKSACFHCETHGADCPISLAVTEIKRVMEEEV